MIDSHCHLDLPAFDGQIGQILASCKAIGIDKVLVPGLTLQQFKKLLGLQKEHPSLDIALGCHPYYLKNFKSSELKKQMSKMADIASQHKKRIVAIGECGLDGSLPIAMDYQECVLRYQIQIAKAVNKPLVLHHRQSHNSLIRMLKNENFDGGGVIHAFSGSIQIAKTYIDLGFVLGVGGTITYPRALKTRTTIANVSLQHLLLETDAPDMPILGYQGLPNTPERLPLIAAVLAELQNCSIEKVAEQTTQNYDRIFSL